MNASGSEGNAKRHRGDQQDQRAPESPDNRPTGKAISENKIISHKFSQWRQGWDFFNDDSYRPNVGFCPDNPRLIGRQSI
jgi:hypothetical protein